jgi:hypothetical protein
VNLRAAIAISMLCTTGCVGARTSVVAHHSHYPVSLSRGLRDRDGSLVAPERRKIVGKFTSSHTAWNLVYSAAKLTPTTDISDEVNSQVAAAGGDAIVQLTIVTRACALDYFVFPFGVLPFWPSCAFVDVHGDIVRVEQQQP